MIGHFSADELADYRAGSISAGQAARIRAHLPGCSECTQVSSDLDGVSRLLSSIPAPPMPSQVTERLQGIIAAEASRRAPGVPGSSDQVAATTRTSVSSAHLPGRHELPRRRAHGARRLHMPNWSMPLVLRGLAVAGVFVLLIGGGVLLVNRGSVPGRPAAGAASAKQARPAPGPVPQHSGVNVGSAAAGQRVRYKTSAGFGYASAEHTGANYSAANLAAGVRKEVASTASFSTASNTTASPLVLPNNAPGGPSHRIGGLSVTQLQSCLALVAGGHPVLLANVARYLGKPAVIVVLKPVHNAFRVVVAGLACGTRGGDVLRRLSVPKG